MPVTGVGEGEVSPPRGSFTLTVAAASVGSTLGSAVGAEVKLGVVRTRPGVLLFTSLVPLKALLKISTSNSTSHSAETALMISRVVELYMPIRQSR